MTRRTKLSLAALVLLLVTGLLFLTPPATLSPQWRSALLGMLLLPLLVLVMALAEGIVEGAFLVVERVLVYALTFGKVRVERESEFVRFPWYGVSRARMASGSWSRTSRVLHC
jgi:hypothetical protein